MLRPVYVYVITITQGADTHTVTTIDAAEAPRALRRHRGVLDLVRPAD